LHEQRIMLLAGTPARVGSGDQATYPAIARSDEDILDGDITKVGHVSAHLLASLKRGWEPARPVRRPLPRDVRERLPTAGTLDYWIESLQIAEEPRPRTGTLVMAEEAEPVSSRPPPSQRQRISTPSSKGSLAPWILPIVAAILMVAGAGYVSVNAWAAIPASGDWSEP
jgi:hypothetical protein